MAPTIHLVRHAQGEHNAQNDDYIRDPPLTPLGASQCQRLCGSFPHMDEVTHLVASPMRRTIETCLKSFAPAAKRLFARGGAILLVPELQETGAIPCDIGSPTSHISAEFRPYNIDLVHVPEDWHEKGPTSTCWPTPERVHARAAKARRLLRDLARGADDNAHIVVVTHGAFVHFLTQDYLGVQPGRGASWRNAEWRSYQFASLDGGTDDDEASLMETRESVERRQPERIWRDVNEKEKAEMKRWAEERVELHTEHALEFLRKGHAGH